jgi:hypothetical protein
MLSDMAVEAAGDGERWAEARSLLDRTPTDLAVDPLALYDVHPSRPPLAVLRRARGLSLQRLACR